MRFSELMKRVTGREGLVVGEVRVGGDPEVVGVCDDSRKVRAGDLFVARSGVKVDGAKYVADAVARGAVAVVVGSGQACGDVACAEVGDVNLACALLAHEVAGNPTREIVMIGVTGTKGKTTVAYLMRSVLRAAGFKVGMVGTVEIDDGEAVVPAEMTTPGSVELAGLFARMKGNGVTHCVMEVSSHALDQRRVAGIAWKVGIFTNLTGDHLDYHGTMEAYGAAKAKLFEGLGEDAVAVVNADDSWGERMVEGCKARVVRYRVEMGTEKTGLAVAKRPENGWSALVTRLSSDGMMVNLAGPDEQFRRDGMKSMYRINTPLVGRHNAYNLACVIAAAHALSMPDAQFMKGVRVFESATGAPGRLQRVQCKSALSVFVDYAHTHDALENVLRALRATMGVPPEGGTTNPPKGGTTNRLICVFGCGGDRDRTKRPKMGAVAERLADVVIVTSDNPRTEDAGGIIGEICAGFSEGWREKGKIVVEADRRAAIRAAVAQAAAGDVVVIAGKGHENYQIIGTTKHHFDDVEEAEAALRERGL